MARSAVQLAFLALLCGAVLAGADAPSPSPSSSPSSSPSPSPSDSDSPSSAPSDSPSKAFEHSPLRAPARAPSASSRAATLRFAASSLSDDLDAPTSSPGSGGSSPSPDNFVDYEAGDLF